MNIDLDRAWYCTNCGKKILYPIPRRKGKERALSHLKKLWCTNCKKECNTVETKEYTHYDRSCFELEYNYGNFDSNGNRILEYKEFLKKLRKEGVI